MLVPQWNGKLLCSNKNSADLNIIYRQNMKYFVYILPAVFVAPSRLALIPSVVLDSSSSFFSSSPRLPPASWAGSKDWLRPLSLSLQFCPEELPTTTGEALHDEEGLFVGLMATVCCWDPRGRGVEVGGPPFLPKAACSLPTILCGLLCRGLTPGPMVELFELTGGWGLQSGGGLEGVVLDCTFFPLDVRTGTGGGDETGAAGEGWGEVWGRSWGTSGIKGGPSLCGEAGGVWKLSPWAPKEEQQLSSDEIITITNQITNIYCPL